MTSSSARPLCESPALRIGMSCALSPEKPRATNVAPSVSASRHGIDRRLHVGVALLRRRAKIRRRRELTLREPVHAVVLDHVQHAHVAPDRVTELAESDRERIAVARDADVGERAIRGVRAGHDRRHAPVHGVEAVRLLHEIRGRLGRAADAAHLRRAVRRNGELPEGLHERGGHGVVSATGAQRGHHAFVVARREPERVGLQPGMTNGRFGD